VTWLFPRLSCLLVLAVAACKGPSVPSLIKDEPVCDDLSLAGATLKGGLQYPIQLKVKDGDALLATVMLYGVPKSSNQPTRFLLPDVDREVTLEWAQCKNLRAPTTTDPRDRKSKGEGPAYDCGEAAVYATTQHTLKEGDVTSHEIAMVLGEGVDVTCATAK
jgi:hypothetical protein